MIACQFSMLYSRLPHFQQLKIAPIYFLSFCKVEDVEHPSQSQQVQIHILMEALVSSEASLEKNQFAGSFTFLEEHIFVASTRSLFSCWLMASGCAQFTDVTNSSLPQGPLHMPSHNMEAYFFKTIIRDRDSHLRDGPCSLL